MPQETPLIAFGHRHPIVTGLLAALFVTALAFWNFPDWNWIAYVAMYVGFSIFFWLWVRPGGLVARLFPRGFYRRSNR